MRKCGNNNEKSCCSEWLRQFLILAYQKYHHKQAQQHFTLPRYHGAKLKRKTLKNI